MFPVPQVSPSKLKGQDADLEAKIWAAGARKYEDTEDIFTTLEGGENALIETETRLSAGVGHEITFRQESGFYGEGKLDENDFEADDEYEELLMASDKLRVGYIRNATTEWFLTGDELGMGNELNRNLNEKLGEWLGREKSWQMAMSLIHQVKQDNHWPIASLGLETLSDATALLRPMGGTPAYLKKDTNGNDIYGLCYLTSTEGMSVLKDDTEFNDRLKHAGERGRGNPLFTGESVMLDGNLIKHWDIKDHDGEGPVGSPLNPKAFLGAAIAAGTATFDIKGGGYLTAANKTKKMYFRYFPAYNFKFAGSSSVAVDAFSHFLHLNGADKRFYVTIVNPKNAATDPGKWCIYECSVNNGNKLVVTKRLGPGTSSSDDVGVRSWRVGSVIWDAAKHTQTHGEGSLIYWSTAAGVPQGRTIGMGKGAARRGYGQFRAKRFHQQIQGGQKHELFIGSVFGQRPRVDRIKRNPAVIVLTHPIKYPGCNHPTP